MSLTVEIQEAIARNMPAEVGSALQKRLKQADADKAELDEARAQIERHAKRIKELEVNAKRASDLDAQHDHLAKNAERLRVEQSELDHRIAIAAVKQAGAENTCQQIKEIVSLVFCSPVSKRLISESVNRPTVNRDGYQQGSVSEVRTVTEESTGPGLQAH